jgi:hypothetical protein
LNEVANGSPTVNVTGCVPSGSGAFSQSMIVFRNA